MAIKQKKQGKVEQIVDEALKKEQLHEVQSDRRKREAQKKHFRSLLPLHATLGILAAIAMYALYGGNNLLHTVLSWTIGIALVGAALALLPDHL